MTEPTYQIGILGECLHYQRYVVTLSDGKRVFVAVPFGEDILAKAKSAEQRWGGEILSVQFLETVNLTGDAP